MRSSVQRATEESREAAEGGQHARLHQELPDELATARPERQPHRHLSLACGSARQQQVGDVRAGDDQHEGGDAEE